jgi:6-phosphogluconate dehydrogenase
VKAGAPVDSTIDKLVEVFEEGDVIVDGGNSHFPGQSATIFDVSKFAVDTYDIHVLYDWFEYMYYELN